MNGKSAGLYLVGGITGLLSGILMFVSGCLVIFRLKETLIGTAEQQLGFIAHHPLSGIVHGLSVVSLILIVPTIIAVLNLLGITTPTRGSLRDWFCRSLDYCRNRRTLISNSTAKGTRRVVH